MISRRKFTTGSALTVAAAALASPIIPVANAVEINEDGLHVQKWFRESFLEIGEDHKELSAENKHLAILFEQRGCPYCRELHEVNLEIPEIVDYIKQHFGVLQINMWGSRLVTDIDGSEIEEREYARKWRVNFTPTIIFLRPGDIDGIPMSLVEAARMPGYLKPFHFISMFEYVAEKHYEDQLFQNFLQDKIHKMKAEGDKPKT